MDLSGRDLRSRICRPSAGLKLPLERLRPAAATGVSGTAHFVPAPGGLLVSNKGGLALVSLDLQAVRWRRELPFMSSGLDVADHTVIYGPYGERDAIQHELAEIIVADGTTVRIEPVPKGLLVGGTDSTILIATVGSDDKRIICIDRTSLRERWRKPGHTEVHGLAAAGNRYFVPTRYGLTLECIDDATGEVLWCFEPPGTDPSVKPFDRGNAMVLAFPSVAAIAGRVIVTTMEQKVHCVAADSGELIAIGEPLFRGAYAVTETSVFFAQPFGLSEFDHREMKEVDRIEYRAEVEPRYKGARPTMNAMCLSEDAVIWTTMEGAFMGASRKPAADRRAVWVDEVNGALMPIGVSPLVFDGHMYYSVRSTDLAASGLYAYRGVV